MKAESSIAALAAGVGARQQALRLIGRVAEAGVRLHDPSDAEALHDFRVALRRLRTFCRAYATHLPLGRRTRRRLRKLARSTGTPRDAEVGLEWLRGVRGEMRGSRRAGLRWLLERLRQSKDRSYEKVRREVPIAWLRVETRLRRRLAAGAPSDAPDVERFGVVAGRRVDTACDALERKLGQIASIEDTAAAHRARVLGKRLRYLLEPFRGEIAPEVPQALERLKAFQDVFGELNDSEVLLGRLREAAEEAAAERAARLFDVTLAGADARELRAARQRSELPGLLEIARLARDRRLERFERIREGYLDGRAAKLLTPARAAAARLSATATRPELRVVPDERRVAPGD